MKTKKYKRKNNNSNYLEYPNALRIVKRRNTEGFLNQFQILPKANYSNEKAEEKSNARYILRNESNQSNQINNKTRNYPTVNLYPFILISDKKEMNPNAKVLSDLLLNNSSSNGYKNVVIINQFQNNSFVEIIEKSN